MDVLAALALVLVLEGLAVVVFSSSLEELLARLSEFTERERRIAGWAMVATGAIAYLVIRG